MDLRHYLFENRVTATELAKKINTTPGQVSLWANGKQIPNMRFATKIYKATNKQVGMEDWIKEESA
jgi:transcriptional regulator with XRE-family HTH domain